MASESLKQVLDEFMRGANEIREYDQYETTRIRRAVKRLVEIRSYNTFNYYNGVLELQKIDFEDSGCRCYETFYINLGNKVYGRYGLSLQFKYADAETHNAIHQIVKRLGWLKNEEE